MAGTLSLVTAPSCEPIALEVARDHLRISHGDLDTQILRWIASAREWCESLTGRQLIGATWEQSLDAFPRGPFALPKAPLLTVSSIKYLDTTGTEQTLSSAYYRVKAFAGPQCRPGHVSLAYGYAWPAIQPVRDAVTVRFTAGYTAPAVAAATAQAAVPSALVQAMLLVIGDHDRIMANTHVGSSITEVPLAAKNLAGHFIVDPDGAV